MRDQIDRYVFREPSGWRKGLVFSVFSVIWFGMYAYFGLLHNSGSVSDLITGVAFALVAGAELLPKDRRRTAGVLRLAAIGILAVLLGLMLLVPDMVLNR